MPSNKPRVTVYTDEITNAKLAYIAKIENRSSSNYTEYLIKKAIAEYENTNGEIKVELNILAKTREILNNSELNPIEKAKALYNAGEERGIEYADKLMGKK